MNTMQYVLIDAIPIFPGIELDTYNFDSLEKAQEKMIRLFDEEIEEHQEEFEQAGANLDEIFRNGRSSFDYRMNDVNISLTEEEAFIYLEDRNLLECKIINV